MNPPARYSACIKAFLAGIIKKYGSYLYYSFRTDVADNPDFDTMTPSYKSGVSLLQKRGQTGRAWGQIPNYVNLMGSKQIPQALVLRDLYLSTKTGHDKPLIRH